MSFAPIDRMPRNNTHSVAMNSGPLVVTYPLSGRSRAIVAEELGGVAEIICLSDLAPAERAAAFVLQ